MSQFSWFQRTVLRVMVLVAGGVFALDGCDPTVKSTVLGGLETASTGLATTFIQALFVKLQSTDTGTTTTSGSTTLLPTTHGGMLA